MKSLWEEVNAIKKRIFEGEDINEVKKDLSRLREEIGRESFEKIMLLINNSIIEKKRESTGNYTINKRTKWFRRTKNISKYARIFKN